jgi:hypothetical protein
LYNSSFVSAYSTLDPDEDFAETYAHFNIFNTIKPKLIFRDPKDHIEVSIDQRIYTKRLKEKTSYLESFLTNEEQIIYP